MRHTSLKQQLEDLVDRTGRVEDMLEVLAGIYRERARTSRYRTDPDLHDAMLATAHVLHEASEAVAAIFGEEDEEALEHGAERAAWQARHEEGRANPRHRRNPPLLPGFTSKFSFFPDEADDYTPPPLTETRRVFRDVKRGDVVTVGKTRWVIMRPVGDVQAYAYKHPSKRTKLYEIRLADTDDDVVVFEIGGSAQRISDDLVRGPLRATRETVEL